MAATAVLTVPSATYTADYDSGLLSVTAYTTLELDINLTELVGLISYISAQLYRVTTNNELAPWGPPLLALGPSGWASVDFGPSSSGLFFVPVSVKLHIAVPIVNAGDSATFSISMWGK